jgi:hypothetical protein
MKRKLAIFTVLGALLALAVPAGAGASISPASTKFEIGTVTGQEPRLTTSLGSCGVKISGETPKSPANLTAALTFGIPTPTAASCNGGASVSFAGEWKAQASGYVFNVYSSASEAITMRFSSLPSCKLTSGPLFNGWWSNGVASPALKSGYHAWMTKISTWANDGGTCALAGQTEPITWLTGTKIPTLEQVNTFSVNNLTSPSTPIIVGN